VSDSTAALGQAKYQVRFDWGADGADRVVPGAHVAVLVDALFFTTAAVVAAERQNAGTDAANAAEATDATDTDAPAPGDSHTAALAASLSATEVEVFAASLRNRSAVAERILALQEQRGERVIVAVIAAGEPAGVDGVTRFTIEDQLTAGAVVDALVALGLDHTAPEAAVASAAYEGLRNAVVHLVGASGSGLELTAAGRRADVRLATERDVTTVVPSWRDGAFRA
jgi:2-phosphosulfolactate phosphatase